MATTTLFRAARILTMNPMQPEATCVAVRDGRILAVGDERQASAWGEGDWDDRFAGKVLMPGLVEGHSHLFEGKLWQYPYVGYYDRRGPDGRLWTGLRSFDAVVARLSEFERDLRAPSEPLLAWGFDPIFFGTRRMTTRELDQVSGTRPIAVLHASAHLLNVNTAMLEKVGIDRDTDVEGVARYPDGSPSGELQEFAAMFPVMRATGNALSASGAGEERSGDLGGWRSLRASRRLRTSSTTGRHVQWTPWRASLPQTTFRSGSYPRIERSTHPARSSRACGGSRRCVGTTPTSCA